MSIILIDNRCIENIHVCKVNNMYRWSIIGQMVPQSCEVGPQYRLQWYIEMDTVYIGKGCSFIWCKPQHYTTYRRGVKHAVHLVIDDWRCTLLFNFDTLY